MDRTVPDAIPCVSRRVAPVFGSLHKPARHRGVPDGERVPAGRPQASGLSRQHGAARPGAGGGRQDKNIEGEHNVYNCNIRPDPQDHQPTAPQAEAGGHREPPRTDSSQAGRKDRQD